MRAMLFFTTILSLFTAITRLALPLSRAADVVTGDFENCAYPRAETALPISRAAAPQAEPTPRPDLELVGHIGGMGGDVLLSGDTLYWAQEYELAILDVSQPANPRRVGYLLLPGTIRDIDLYGSYLYVIWQHRCLWGGCAATGEISIVDVSDPQHPYQAATYSLPALPAEMSIADGYAYSLWTPSGEPQLSGMSILDLSDPLAPQMMSWVDLQDPVSIMAANGYGYVSLAEFFCIYDVTDPRNPVYLNNYFPANNKQMLVYNEYAYTVSQYETGVSIYDLSIPTEPKHVMGIVSIGDASSIKIQEDFLYIAEGHDWLEGTGGGLQIVDILSPTHSVQVGYFDVPDGAASVSVGNGVAYLSTDYSGLKVIDVGNPAQPSLLAEWLVSNDAQSIAMQNKQIFIANNRNMPGSGGLSAFDAKDAVNPIGVAYLATSLVGYTGSSAITLDGNFAYLCSSRYSTPSYRNRFYVVDITDFRSPSLLGALQDDAYYGKPYRELTAANGYAYIGYQDKVAIIDATNPAKPKSVGSIPANCGVRDLVAQNNRLYVGDCGLRIFDLSDPANPAEIGSIGLPNYIQALDVAGQYAYLGGGNNLYVVQITDPISPTLRGWATLSTGEFDQIAVSNGYAFVAGGTAGHFFVVNATDPAYPFQSEMYVLEDFTDGVTTSGGYVYLLSWRRGLFVFRFNPILHEQYLPLVRR